MNKEDLKKYGKAPKPADIELTDINPTVEELRYYKDAWIADARKSGLIEILEDACKLWGEYVPDLKRNNLVGKWMVIRNRNRVHRFDLGDNYSVSVYFSSGVKTKDERSAPAKAKNIVVVKGGKPPFELIGASERGELLANFRFAECEFDGFGYETIINDWIGEAWCIPGQWCDLVFKLKEEVAELKAKIQSDLDKTERDLLIKELKIGEKI